MNGKIYIILIVIVAVLSLAIAGLAAYVFIVSTNPGDRPVQASEKQAVKIDYEHVTKTIPFKEEGKVINLKKTDDKAHIVKLQVEILSKTDKKLDKELQLRATEIQEIIITTFNEKTIEEIQSSEESKEKIKQELLKKLNTEFATDKFLKIVFNDWFYQ